MKKYDFSWRFFYKFPTPAHLRKWGDAMGISCMSTAMILLDKQYSDTRLITGLIILGLIGKGLTNCFKEKE